MNARLFTVLACALAICGLLGAAVAHAGPPTAMPLLKKLTAARSGVHSIQAVYTLRLPPESAESPIDPGRTTDQSIRETIFFRAPNRLRLNLSWPDREEVFLAVGLNTLVMVGDQATNTAWPQPLLLYRLLLDSDPEGLARLLPALEIDTTVVSAAKQDRRPIDIIGASPDDAGPSQAWFDRKTGRLVRLIVAPAKSQPAYDIHLLDYRRHNDRIDWPHTMHVWSGPGPAVARLTLSALTVNPEIAPDTPDPEELRRTVAPAPNPDAGATRHPELLKIQKQMEWFRKKLE